MPDYQMKRVSWLNVLLETLDPKGFLFHVVLNTPNTVPLEAMQATDHENSIWTTR